MTKKIKSTAPGKPASGAEPKTRAERNAEDWAGDNQNRAIVDLLHTAAMVAWASETEGTRADQATVALRDDLSKAKGEGWLQRLHIVTGFAATIAVIGDTAELLAKGRLSDCVVRPASPGAGAAVRFLIAEGFTKATARRILRQAFKLLSINEYPVDARNLRSTMVEAFTALAAGTMPRLASGVGAEFNNALAAEEIFGVTQLMAFLRDEEEAATSTHDDAVAAILRTAKRKAGDDLDNQLAAVKDAVLEIERRIRDGALESVFSAESENAKNNNGIEAAKIAALAIAIKRREEQVDERAATKAATIAAKRKSNGKSANA
jgi:DNA-binding FrmR family transcriptional regulator